jgi:hypothetical protein
LSYGTQEEYSFRYEQFLRNDQEIQKINGQEGNTYTVAHNKFSTLTKWEFEKNLGRKTQGKVDQGVVVELDASNLTASVDWRAEGAVNPVQN